MWSTVGKETGLNYFNEPTFDALANNFISGKIELAYLMNNSKPHAILMENIRENSLTQNKIINSIIIMTTNV